MSGPLRRSHGRRLSPQNLGQKEELAGSSMDPLIARSRTQASIPSDAGKRRSVQGFINKDPWMSQLLTEEAHRGCLDGAPDRPPAGTSGTLKECLSPPSPINPTASGPPSITTPDAVAISSGPTMPNSATILRSPSAGVTATGRLDATTPSAPATSSAPDVPPAEDPKLGKRRSTLIAGK